MEFATRGAPVDAELTVPDRCTALDTVELAVKRWSGQTTNSDDEAIYRFGHIETDESGQQVLNPLTESSNLPLTRVPCRTQSAKSGTANKRRYGVEVNICETFETFSNFEIHHYKTLQICTEEDNCKVFAAVKDTLVTDITDNVAQIQDRINTIATAGVNQGR